MQELYAWVIIWPICGEGGRPSSIFNEPAVFPSTKVPCQADGTKLERLNPPKVIAYQMASLMNPLDTAGLFHTILNVNHINVG